MPTNKEPVDRSRQHLANERTFLSWMRTSIALVGLGFIVARFGLFLREFGLVVKTNNNININNSNNNAAATDGLFGHYQSSPLIGVTIIILGIVLIVLALCADLNHIFKKHTFAAYTLMYDSMMFCISGNWFPDNQFVVIVLVMSLDNNSCNWLFRYSYIFIHFKVDRKPYFVACIVTHLSINS